MMRATRLSRRMSGPESASLSILAIPKSETNQTRRLKGKTAIVTGGDSGIGRAAAIMFALEGARGITITYLPDEEEDAKEAARDIENAGAKAVIVKCDLVNNDDCKKVVDEHIKAFGTLNVLVNNASKQMCVQSLPILQLCKS
jgi:NAD(P)-dependent dehydrogenase (short-subunit alcohol dehydrogenase family)